MGPLAAALERAETAVAFEPLEDGDGGFAVAVHGGGEVVQVAAAGADRLAALWLLAAHVVVHDAKAQPGYTAAPCGPGFDTAVAAYLLAPELPEKERTLFALGGADDGAVLVDGPRAEAAAATRAVLTWRVAAAQRPRLVELGLERLFREIELPLVHVLAQMEAAGVKMDPYRLGEITARLRDRVDELRDEIIRLAGGTSPSARRSSSPRSSSCASAWSPARRARPATRPTRACCAACATSTPSSRPSRSGASSPSCSTRTSSRCRSTSTRAPGACTRPSSRWSPRPGASRASDPNLQNIPVRTELGAEIRACFVAEDGCRLVVADYSQIELRLMALLSQEPALLDAYRRGEDVHRVTAAAVAGIPPDEVTQAPARARQGDQLRHHVRALRLRPLGAGRHPGGGGQGVHRRLLRQVPEGPRVPRARHRARRRGTAT